jgi:primase-polymerase (primpol)-like protein
MTETTSSESSESESLSDGEVESTTTLEEGRFHVPESIRQTECWIGFRLEECEGGKIQKVPKGPYLSSKDTLYKTNPASRRDAVTFGEAIDFVDESRERLGDDGADGVGLVLTGDDDIAGVDLDDCRDPETGDVDGWAFDIVQQLDSYTEVSPSGTGLHVLVKGELDEDFKQKDGDRGLELYDEGQFLTFTGRWIPSTPDKINERDGEFQAVQRAHLDEVGDDVDIDDDDLPELPTGDDVELEDEDEELIRKAKRTDPQFERLWDGDISGQGGDHSSADFCLGCKLAYRCYSDMAQMDRIFRQSGLMREKWDAPRGNVTYGVLTMREAIKKNGR